MESELRIDPRILEEFLQMNRNILDAPKLVAAPDEISLGMTPYDVVYSEGKMRLLHFNSTQQKQVKTPLLITYALINRYHILDIHPQKSWVKNMLEQGLDVYLIDWGTPTTMDRFLGFDDYVNGYMDNCVDFILNESGVGKVSMQGYCTGGTLATVYASLYPEKIKNLILTAPVIDGSRDSTVVANLAKHMDVDKMADIVGNVPPEFMYYVFSILKPFEQGLEKYAQFFKNIHNKEYVENFIRVEKWLSDTPPIPGELFREWVKNVYQDNLLIKNQMYVSGRQINLKNISMPVFTQVAVGDHLVSPECSMPIHYAVSSEDKTLRMYATGHVGMIASSFSQKKVLPELGQWIKERSEK
ncbi:MAG: class III poly(R)-hydroxyalkanoic acid synthase subunit PhaC [Thaumarchaeota archaeon]|nr:class III poly(R)-hydroxyalkanoic acid synthase subunit PhaC [Nitrososphaerota archaeon]MDE1872281.1 class III poly(R)-hydroxyalkanoic acid synthase subunit PhaC [Nitrososphaerota archaeon]